jgi:hypothetical protein
MVEFDWRNLGAENFRRWQPKRLVATNGTVPLVISTQNNHHPKSPEA